MENQPESRQGKTKRYTPKPETLALLKVSGNPVNGLGDTTRRRALPFFWHPPEAHPYGELQIAARRVRENARNPTAWLLLIRDGSLRPDSSRDIKSQLPAPNLSSRPGYCLLGIPG